MEVEELFFRASEGFQENNFEGGLALITECIEKDSQNSSLYSNRALFYEQLGNNEAAFGDLVTAIAFNHLNYTAYFNLFSLQYRAGQQHAAFENLCCSLSCLYLLRAKKRRQELDLQHAISYADNNFEAYVLKALMHLENGRITSASNCIEYACDINPQNLLSRKLKSIIGRKVNPYALEDFEKDGEEVSKRVRLKSSYKCGENFQEEIRQKLKEFNHIYEDLNGEKETVIQKMPKILKQSGNLQKSFHGMNELSGIYESRLNSSKTIELCVSFGMKECQHGKITQQT